MKHLRRSGLLALNDRKRTQISIELECIKFGASQFELEPRRLAG
jgi:hypothetical protein